MWLRRGIVAVITATVAGAGAPAASGATFCVQDPACPAGATPVATLPDAVAAADAADGRERIQIGPGTFEQPSVVVAPGNPVDIVGAGRDKTTLRRNDSGGPPAAVLSLNEYSSTLSDLAIGTDGTDTVGIVVGGDFSNRATAERIDVIGTTPIAGVALPGGILRNARVVEPLGANSLGVIISRNALVEDTDITASTGVTNSEHPLGGSAKVKRTRIQASAVGADLPKRFIFPSGQPTINLFDDLIRVTGAGTGVRCDDCVTGLHHLSIITDVPTGTTGVSVTAQPNDANNRHASAAIDSSIIRGFERSIVRIASTSAGSGTADATVLVNYSDVDLSASKVTTTNTSGGPAATGAILQNLGHNVDVDPGFVNAAAGDFRLRFDSPLVDVGLPQANDPLLEPLDLDRNPTNVDGNGDMTATPDIGALEYQRRAPAVTAGAASPTAATGESVGFTGAATDPDGDPLGPFQWTFDDGATATGPSVTHAFSTPGAHTATLRVADGAGIPGTATASVNVVTPDPGPPGPGPPGPEPPGPGPGPLPPPPLSAPVISGFTATSKKGKPGPTFRYSLSRAAAVTIALDRVLPGRVSGTKCVAPTRRNRTAKKCSRFARTGVLTQAGRAGTNSLVWNGRFGTKPAATGPYRATATAVAGTLKSVPKTLMLEVVKLRR